MTVSSTTNRFQFSGDGSTVDFTFSGKVLQDADLDVYVDSTLQTLTTNYTVSGAGAASTSVTVSFGTAPASGTVVTLVRNPEQVQPVDWLEGGADPAEQQETAFDRATLIAQRNADLADRSLVLPEYDPAADLTLPAKTSRASKLLAFDSDGAPIAYAGSVPGAVAVSTFMETVLDDADAAAARSTLGFGSVSRYVMKSQNGGSPTSNYWLKIFDQDITNTAALGGTDKSITLLIEASEVAGRNDSALVQIIMDHNDAGDLDTASSGIRVISISTGTVFPHNRFKLISNTDNNAQLWVQKLSDYTVVNVTELSVSKYLAGTPPVYNSDGVWSATDPTTGKAVVISGGWAGTDWASLTVGAGWTDMVIKYRRTANGTVQISLAQTTVVGTVTDGTAIATLPPTFRHASLPGEVPMPIYGGGGTNGQIGEILIAFNGQLKLYNFVATPNNMRGYVEYQAEQ